MTRAPVEAKVQWASVATYIASVAGIAVLRAFTDDGLIAALPDPFEPVVLALLPAATAWLGGFKARHTPRPDLDDPPGDHAAGPDRPAFKPNYTDEDPRAD